MKKEYWFRKYVAEFLGTFLFLFGGMSAISGAQMGFVSTTDLLIPLAFGGSLMVAVFSLGHICGAHFNPAVTIGFAVRKHFPWKRVLPYIIAQVLGALLATALIMNIFSGKFSMDVLATTPNFPEMSVFIAEFISTFFLVFVIASVAIDKRTSGIPNGLAIGGVLFAIALTGGWIGGGSFNPARTIAPAILTGEMTGFWIYMLAPILGGIVAVAVYDYLKKED